MASAATPERIGRYVVREVIGAGAFATVYRATDERLGVDVALKVLAENHSLDPSVRERFIEEGRRLRRVRGRHLVTVHDLGETDRAQPYLVLEWADRGDLSRRVADARRHGVTPGPGDAHIVVRSLAAALHALHDQQLVHRDLAPRNVLLSSVAMSPVPALGTGPLPPPRVLTADETVLLADLGLSKDLAVASGLTVAAGTSGFAPPEQREDGGTVDGRSDIWAASALTVWLAIDRPPDDAGRWQRELQGGGWPSAMCQALSRGLARQPGDRHPSIGAWLVDLEKALVPPPGRSDVPRPPQERVAPLPRPRRSLRARMLVGVAILASLLVGTGLALVASGLQDDGPHVSVEQVGDDRRRTVVEDHGITIELEGPTATDVGETAQLTVDVRGADGWTWVGPDGALVTGASSFQVRALSAGRATVRILATDSHGRVVEATHRLLVA